jgi:hypothetical protein
MRTCSIDGCDRPHEARGWCARHHKRWLRNGTTDLVRQPPAPCSVDGCDRTSRRAGLCTLHFARVERNGTVEPRTLATRFESKWEQSDVAGALLPGCWVWTGVINPNGYGQIAAGDGTGMTYAHRVSHQLHVGPIPEGFHVDHLCNIRHCVNPAHLEAVTPAENARRMGERRRAA